MKPTRTWIVVADGARSRVVERLGLQTKLRLISGSDMRTEIPKSNQLGQDRPGRVHESVGSVRHAIEPKHDAHQEMENQFAGQVVAFLDAAHGKNEFDHLVIVAPPIMLGNLRKKLSTGLRKLVVDEVDKDLTKIPNDEILQHLEI